MCLVCLVSAHVSGELRVFGECPCVFGECRVCLVGDHVCPVSVRVCLVSHVCLVSARVSGESRVFGESCVWAVPVCLVGRVFGECPCVSGESRVFDECPCVWGVVCFVYACLVTDRLAGESCVWQVPVCLGSRVFSIIFSGDWRFVCLVSNCATNNYSIKSKTRENYLSSDIDDRLKKPAWECLMYPVSV